MAEVVSAAAPNQMGNARLLAAAAPYHRVHVFFQTVSISSVGTRNIMTISRVHYAWLKRYGYASYLHALLSATVHLRAYMVHISTLYPSPYIMGRKRERDEGIF